MRYLLLFASVVLLMSQCSPVYIPNSRNTPLFAKAGEFQGALQFGTNGIDLQSAVAVTNNIAVMGNYSYGNRNTDTLSRKDNDNYHKHNFYEGAIGYYKNDRKFCFEIFVGLGKGEATSFGSYSGFSSSGDEYATGKFTRIFLQPSFGINKKYMTLGFTPRFSVVDFSEFYGSSTKTKWDFEPKIFIEPAFTARFNFLDNRFFGTLQVGASLTPTDNVVFDYEPFHVSTGLGFRLGGLRWNNDETKE